MRTLQQRSYFWLRWTLFSAVFLLSGCAISLAPSYDKDVVAALASSNVACMTLFATTATGTQAADFANRANSYASLIGQLDALAIQAGARPIPKNKVSETINQMLAKRGVDTVSDDSTSVPSATALKKISEVIAKMRDVDQKQGLQALEVRLFKNSATLYFDQAITYENFLQR